MTLIVLQFCNFSFLTQYSKEKFYIFFLTMCNELLNILLLRRFYAVDTKLRPSR